MTVACNTTRKIQKFLVLLAKEDCTVQLEKIHGSEIQESCHYFSFSSSMLRRCFVPEPGSLNSISSQSVSPNTGRKTKINGRVGIGLLFLEPRRGKRIGLKVHPLQGNTETLFSTLLGCCLRRHSTRNS